MKRACALLLVLGLALAACGKYGPPVRSRPTAAEPSAATEPAAADDEERESSQ